MLQAAEQNIGLAIARELLAADALCDGRLVKLSPLTIVYEQAHAYHLVYPPALRDWAPVAQFRRWLREELDLSSKTLHPTPAKRKRVE
jgi:LysR family glycine cleavage system transcriptional activator